MTFLKRQDAALCAKIEPGRCLDCREGNLRIGFAKGYLFRDDVEAHRGTLEARALQFFGTETAVTFETLAEPDHGVNGNGQPDGAAAKALRLQEVRREVLSHPLFLKILDVFPGARVGDTRLREAASAPPLGEMPEPPSPDGEEPLLQEEHDED